MNDPGYESRDAAAAANAAAWRGAVRAAWLERFGPPERAAAETRARPAARLAGLDLHLGDVRGRRLVHLLGSNGVKAVALGLLGAEVTVIDLSEGNAAYARELATAAGVPLRYVVADVLALPADERARRYDLALAELGVVHYFQDLAPFGALVATLLAPGGRFVLRDFHPVATKLLSFRGSTAKVRKVKVTGDYFDTALHEEDAPFAKFLPPEAAACAGKVRWRRWTLGEVVTAFAEAGLRVERLVEEPNRSSDVFDAGIPKTFTLVATKPAGAPADILSP